MTLAQTPPPDSAAQELLRQQERERALRQQQETRRNTDLKGAAIASTDKAVEDGANSLTTGTLTTSDIKNKAHYKASSVGLGFGYTSEDYSLVKGDGTPANSPQSSGVGTNQQGQATTGGDKVPGTEQPSYNGWSATAPMAMGASGNDSSVTVSGISGGVVKITDEAKQKELTGKDAEQTLASLDRSVSSEQDSANALKPIFNEQEIKAGFEIVGALQREVGTFLNNRAKEIDKKNAQAKEADAQASDMTNGLTDEQRLVLIDQANALRAEAQAIDNNWGAGGAYRQIVTALVAGVSGNVTGSTAQFAQNMVVNYVQQQGASYIGKLVVEGTLKEGSPAHAALHAIVACAGAAASNQGCSSGALGAAASSLLTGLFSETNPDETASERQARANLITSLVTGIAMMGDIDTVAASNSAVAAVDNNWLATQQIVQMKKELAEAKSPLEELQVLGKWAYVSKKQDLITAGGIAAGLVYGAGSDVAGFVEFLKDPIKGLNGLKDIITDPNVRAQLGEDLSKKLDLKIELISYSLKHGGDSNAFALGLDIGELVWHVGSAATVVYGGAKCSVMLVNTGIKVGTKGLEAFANATKNAPKSVANTGSKIEDVAKTAGKAEDTASVAKRAADLEFRDLLFTIDPKLIEKIPELLAEIKSLPQLAGKSVGEVRKILQELGYTAVRSDPKLGTGVVWTKDLGNGFTSVVRGDVGSGKIGKADEFLHFHKEGVPTSFVNKGNFNPKEAPVFKFTDLAEKSFKDNWPGNHIQAKMP